MFDLRRNLARLAFSTVLAAGVLLPAQADAAHGIGDADRSLMAVYYSEQSQLQRLATEFDIWAVDREAGFATAYLRPEQLETLRNEGFRMETMAESLTEAAAPLDDRFYHYDDFVTNGRDRYLVNIYNIIDNVAPELSEVIDLGSAWEGLNGEHERRISVVRITNEDPQFGPIEDKPAFFLFANIHAREVATPELALRYIKTLLIGHRGQGGYGVDADTTWLVDHHVAYVLVMQNPDGHAVNEVDANAFRRKNVNDGDGCGFSSALGVDLNRNHSFLWGCCDGSSGDPCSETFRGSSPASEPETQAFQNFFDTVMIDQNGPNGDNEIPDAAPQDTTGVFITLHSFGDLILWPWNFFGMGANPNADGLTRIGRKLAFYNDYSATDGDIGYDVDGASDDWVYGKYGIPSFTFEIGSGGGSCGGFFPDFGCIDGTSSRDFWVENGPAFRYAHKIADTPYITSQGPDAFALNVNGVELTATLEDRRISGETERNILGAEYFIGAPGPEGTGTPLSPADGSWGERNEIGEATVDIGGLPSGEHYVLVRGRTSAGWGPLQGVWIDVN